MPVLLEVNTSGEASKHGLDSDGWRHAFDGVMDLQGIDVQGLMTMAPWTDDEAVIRRCFGGLRRLRDEFGLKHLSMGMSHDYRIAIDEGATIVRIGTEIFRS